MTKATDSTKANGDRPAQEIEITPEMIQAGVNSYYENCHLLGLDSQDGDVTAVVALIVSTALEASCKVANIRS